MIELRLLDGTRLELRGDEIIALTYAVNDIGSIETRQGVSSNEFELPITDFNLNALGYPTNFNVNQNVNPFTKIPAEMFEDEIRISGGYIQITNPSLSGNTIPVVFFGENAEWFNLIKDKSIRELNLSDFTHEFNVTNVEGSFTNTEGYKYILIDKNGNNFNQSNQIALQSWTLSVFQSTIIKKIIESIGFKLKGTLLNDPLYKKTLIPDTNKKFRANNSELSQSLRLFLGAPEQTIDGTASNVNFTQIGQKSVLSPNYEESTDIYTSSDTFYARIEAVVFVEAQTTSEVEVILNKNNVSIFTQTATITAGDTRAFIVESNDVIIGNQGYTLLDVGDEVEVTCRVISGSAGIFQGSFFIDFAEVALENANINIAASLPDINQADFIKEVVFDYNALVTVNLNSKEISFDLKKYNINNSLDWSEKIDLSEDVSINYSDLLENYYQRNKVKRAESDGAFILDYNDNNIVDFGDYEFVIDNDFLEKEGIIFESEFASTYQVRSFNAQLNLPYYPNEIISDTFFIDSITSSGTGSFRAVTTDADLADFEDEAPTSIYLLITESTEVEYNGIWTIDTITEAGGQIEITTKGLTFTNTAEATGRLIRRGEKTEPRKLIDYGNFNVDDLSSYTEIKVSSLTDTNTDFTSIPYTYFYNPIYGLDTDASLLTLSYGNINLPSNNVSLFEVYYPLTLRILKGGKLLRASFRLNQIDIFNLDFNKLVYLNFYINGQTVQGYFIVNKIEEYTGSEDSTVVELIKY